MMQMAPWKRLTAEECLSQPYLAIYHEPSNEPTCSQAVQVDADAIERFSLEECLRQLGQEVVYFQNQRNLYPLELQ